MNRLKDCELAFGKFVLALTKDLTVIRITKCYIRIILIILRLLRC